MLHAIRNAVAVYEQDDEMTMFIGPAQDGTLLEVGQLQPATSTEP